MHNPEARALSCALLAVGMAGCCVPWSLNDQATVESVPAAEPQESQGENQQHAEGEPRPLVDLEREGPEIAASIEASIPYLAIWDADADALTLFLSFVSEGAARMDGFGQARVPLGEGFAPVLRETGLAAVVANLLGYLGRMGRFPADFSRRTRSVFTSVASAPRRGLWSPGSDGPPHDHTALAVLLLPVDPEALRELIAAKDSGPWPSAERDWGRVRPYLTDVRHALRRLVRLTTLTADERLRLDRLELQEVARIVENRARRRETVEMYQRTIPMMPGYRRALVRGVGEDFSAVEVVHLMCSVESTVEELFEDDREVLNQAGFREVICRVPGGGAHRIRFDG